MRAQKETHAYACAGKFLGCARMRACVSVLPEECEHGLRQGMRHLQVFVMYLLPVGLCFGYDAIQPYAGPLSVCVAAVPLFFSMAGLYILLRRR